MEKNIQHLEICIQGNVSPRMRVLPMKKKLYTKNALFVTGDGMILDMILPHTKDKVIAYVSAITDEESILYLNQKQTENVKVYIHNMTNTDASLSVMNMPFNKLDIKGFKELELNNIKAEEINFGKKVRTLKMENVEYKRFGNNV